jgi:hypothetical protein
MKNQNKSLYWYGFFANCKKAIGKLCLFIGGFSLFFNWIIGILFIVGGIILVAKGSSQRFDYKRQSGYIMHEGDR